MTTLYRYQPAVTPGPNGTDPRPSGPDGEDAATSLTHLAELDGWRYVAVPDDITPTVPEAIVATWEVVSLDAALKAALRKASPHLRLIDERVQERIREHYALEASEV